MLSPILAVRDIDASVEFYVRAFGFNHNWSLPGRNGRVDFASVQLGAAEVFLGVVDGMEKPDQRVRRGAGVLLFIDLDRVVGADINMFYQQAVAAGACITRPLSDQEWGERTFHCQDLDGYPLMFAQRIKTRVNAAAA